MAQGQTPIYGLRFPKPRDTPNVPRDIRRLAEDLESELERIDGAVGLVEDGLSLNGVTIGDGVLSSQHRQSAGMLHFHLQFEFGSTSAFTSNVTLDLAGFSLAPTAFAGGIAWMQDSSEPNNTEIAILRTSTGGSSMLLINPPGNVITVDSDTPFEWDEGDRLWIHGSVVLADT